MELPPRHSQHGLMQPSPPGGSKVAVPVLGALRNSFTVVQEATPRLNRWGISAAEITEEMGLLRLEGLGFILVEFGGCWVGVFELFSIAFWVLSCEFGLGVWLGLFFIGFGMHCRDIHHRGRVASFDLPQNPTNIN